jgi:hypothetical protein
MSIIKEQQIFNVLVSEPDINFNEPSAVHSILQHRLFSNFDSNHITRSVDLFQLTDGTFVITVVVDFVESINS